MKLLNKILVNKAFSGPLTCLHSIYFTNYNMKISASSKVQVHMMQPPSFSAFTKLSFSNFQCFPDLSLTVQIDIQSLIHNLIDKVIRSRCLPGSYSLSDAVVNYILNSGNALAAGETRHFFYIEIAACIVPEPHLQFRHYSGSLHTLEYGLVGDQ